MHLDFDKIASELCVSVKLVKLKYDNLSVDKKKELQEFFNDNYSFLHSI